MSLVSYLSNDQADAQIKPIFASMEKTLGAVPNVFRVMAHSPAMLKGFLALNASLHETRLDGKLRELAYIRTSEVNDCAYCLHHHRVLGEKAGLTQQQIAETARFEQSNAYSDLERNVMRYAEQVSRHVKVDDALFARLKAELDERELTELAMTVAIANLTNRMTETLRMELP